MYQHPLVQDLKGYSITKQLAYTNVKSGPAKKHLALICVYSEIVTCYLYGTTPIRPTDHGRGCTARSTTTMPQACAFNRLLAIVPFPVERITEVTHPKLRLPLHPAHKGYVTGRPVRAKGENPDTTAGVRHCFLRRRRAEGA